MSSCLFFLCSKNNFKYDGSKKHLKTIPKEIQNMHKILLDLNLESNMIKTLEKNVFQCKKLKILNLCSNQISEIPDGISELVNLEELTISNNNLNSISDNIRHCQKLIFLNLSRNYIERIPYGVTQLRNLQFLQINEVSLVDLPPAISCLCNLRVLEARSNLIKNIPESISFLSNLVRLDLGCNEITTLPPTIGQLESLQELWLDSNVINDVCKEIGELKNLVIFEMSNNPIQTLPDDISKLENLSDLTLSGCQLISLPETLGNLKELRMLKIDCNQLKELPTSFCDLQNLTEAFMGRNKIFELPDKIGNLKELIFLDVDYNSLTRLPNSICKCSKLSILSLKENYVEFLPNNMGDMKKLVVLDIRGNNIRFLPFSITTCDNIQSIWISKSQQKGLFPMQVVDDPTFGRVLTNILLPQKSQLTRNITTQGTIDEIHESPPIEKRSTEPTIVENENSVQFKDDNENKSELTEKINKLCLMNAESTEKPEIKEFESKGNSILQEDSSITKSTKSAIMDFEIEEIKIKCTDILDELITVEAIDQKTHITYGLKEFNLFITKVVPEELNNANLRAGDRILKICGEEVSTMDVARFEKFLDDQYRLDLVVRHDPPFETFKFITIDRNNMNEPLGLKIKKLKLKTNPNMELLTITANSSKHPQVAGTILEGDVIVGFDNEEIVPGNIKLFEKLVNEKSDFTLVIHRIPSDVAAE